MSKSTKSSKKKASKSAAKTKAKPESSKPAKSAKPASNETTSLDTAYLINGSDAAVTIEIILGAPGQTGTTDIILDRIHIITGEQGSLNEFALGTNRKLNGKTMHITTIVSDTSKDSNYLETIIRLRGGIRFSEYVLYKTVPKSGENAIFTSSIEFFKI